MKLATNQEQVTAANEKSFEDLKLAADFSAGRNKEWEDLKVCVYKGTRKRTFKDTKGKAYVLEPNDMFVFVEAEDDEILLFLEGMKKPIEMTQRVYDTLDDQCKWLRKAPAKKQSPQTREVVKPGGNATKKAANAPKVLPQKDKPAKKVKTVKNTNVKDKATDEHTDSQNILTDEDRDSFKIISMNLIMQDGTGKPLSSIDYEHNTMIGKEFSIAGGVAYFMGVGPKVLRDESGSVVVDKRPYAVFFGKGLGGSNRIMRSKNPVSFNQKGLGLSRVLDLGNKLSYEKYKEAFGQMKDLSKR